MDKETQNQELSRLCYAFLQSGGGYTQKRGSQMLGIPIKTFEHILAGRGFRYPTLLIHALTRFE